MNMIEWILECTSQDKNYLIKHGQKTNWKQGFDCFVCDVCEYVFEEEKYNKVIVTIKHSGFPKYKLDKKTCTLCKEK